MEEFPRKMHILNILTIDKFIKIELVVSHI